MLRFGGNSENSVHSDYMAYNDYFHVLFSLFPSQITLSWLRDSQKQLIDKYWNVGVVDFCRANSKLDLPYQASGAALLQTKF